MTTSHERPHALARITIARDDDIVKARELSRRMATVARCSPSDLTRVAAAVTEVSRNMLAHAGGGTLHMRVTVTDGRRELLIVASDDGPGIAYPERAVQDGYTTGEGLGMGLPVAHRLMDRLTLTSDGATGTVAIMHKRCATDG